MHSNPDIWYDTCSLETPPPSHIWKTWLFNYLSLSLLQNEQVCNSQGTCQCNGCDCNNDWGGLFCEIPVSQRYKLTHDYKSRSNICYNNIHTVHVPSIVELSLWIKFWWSNFNYFWLRSSFILVHVYSNLKFETEHNFRFSEKIAHDILSKTDPVCTHDFSADWLPR